MFYGGNVVRVPVHFFSLLLIFTLHWWPLAFLILSPPLHKIFMLFFQQKNVSFGFSSLTLSPCRPFLVELCWPAAHFLFSSVFLLLYIPNLWTDNLSKLNTLDNTDTETISTFVFMDSFVVSALQDAGGYVISCQNNLELPLGYHTC